MKRKLSFVLSLVCLFSLSSCKVDTDVVDKEVIIAVKYGSANEIACEQYKDYTKATYNSSSDVVLAVENGKADYGILDEFELNSYILNQRAIKEKEQCEYSIDYCAYFSAENEELQDLFNEAIAQLDSDGVLDEITDAHLKGKSFLNGAQDNENGTLTMLCDPSFKNRVYADDNGDVAGLDVDIAKAICNYLGYDLEIVTADFDELFIKLQDGEGDFIMSACEVNEEREEYYLLSDVYFTLNYHLIEKE
ncbi:MAG: transporter substrate-binding domain-containing protein [Clostridia bacterium]|nr:transporter substrate-binding domain-containing protein [Clostridia bacterium]